LTRPAFRTIPSDTGTELVPDLVFLDANVIYSAAHSPASDLRQLWVLPETMLLTSPYAVNEVLRSLPPMLDAEFQRLLDRMTLVLTPLEHTPLPPGLVLPAKDIPIFLAAARSGSTHLLTGDKRHFGPYFGQRFAGVLILPPRLYLEPLT
jgi:hypothetical protein